MIPLTLEFRRMANDAPVTVDFDAQPELKALRDELHATKPGNNPKAFEAGNFAPRFAATFAGLPLHGAPPDLGKPRVLISVLGFSPVPVAYMAAWAKPEAMLCIATERSAKEEPVKGESVAEFIRRVAGLPNTPEVPEFDEHGELDIYRAVRDFIRQHKAAPGEVFVDPTGGKKSMSAAAALAAYREGAVLVYVDYGEYVPDSGRPIAGTEYPRYLRNPLVELAEDEFDRIGAAFNRGAYLEALRRSEELERQSYDYPNEARMCQHLVNGYHQWELGRFKEAEQSLGQLQGLYRTFEHRSPVAQHLLKGTVGVVPSHRTLLESLYQAAKVGEDTPDGSMLLVLNDLAQAQRLLKRGENRWTIITLSVALERYLQHYAKSRCGLIDLRPDDERVPWDAMNMAAQSVKMKCIEPHSQDHIGMHAGLLLLAAHEPKFPLGLMYQIAHRRNELAHAGNGKAPAEDKVQNLIDNFCEMLSTIEPWDDSSLQANLAKFQFVKMPESSPGYWV